MNKIASALMICTSVAATGCHGILFGAVGSGQHVKGNGTVKQETRKIGSFTKIQVGGAVQTEVKVGSGPTLKIEAESNILPLYRTRVEGDTLIIDHKGSISTSKTIKLWITVPSLKGVTVSGASEMSISNLKTPQFEVDLSGASNLTATGSADSLDLTASGASEVNLMKVNAKKATVSASGASKINVNVTGQISGDASGASEVSYKGHPAAKVSTSGASSVRSTN